DLSSLGLGVSGVDVIQLKHEFNIDSWDLAGFDLSFSKFRGFVGRQVNLKLADLSNAFLWGSLLDSNAEDTVLYGARFFESDVFNSSFRRSDLSYSRIFDSSFASSDFSETVLDNAFISRTFFTNVDLQQSSWTRAYVGESSFTRVDFSNTTWRDVAVVTRSSFVDSDFRNATLTAVTSRSDTDFSLCDFRNATLHSAELRGTSLMADWSNATIRDSVLRGDLKYTRFANASLFGSQLIGSVVGATMSGADLSHASLEGTLGLSTVDLTGARYNEYTTFPAGFDPLLYGLVFMPAVAGDMNGDGVLNVLDVDSFYAPVRHSSVELFDLDGDGIVTNDDRLQWVRDVANTSAGDANLDGSFDSSDLVQLFQRNRYEVFDRRGKSDWSEGDFDGDRQFTSSDLVLAFRSGRYEQTEGATHAVPEPGSTAAWTYVLIVALAIFNRREPKMCSRIVTLIARK
ncbi:MAG: pentapeptide repeat-containing protein, partial [Planctomycetales bacterium]|nr:pentapeptide repeat-containing protein [Planctomycetales bacterium]